MKERPILFQGAMVRALLADTKTQTRRALRVQPGPSCCIEEGMPDEAPFVYSQLHGDGPGHEVHERRTPCVCPYGEPGDRLWVREAWMPDPPNDGTWPYTPWAGEPIGQIAGVPDRFRHPAFCNYAASWLHGPVKWTPSIHMPRWASRITVEITGVRVQRLQSISEEDAWAEGCTRGLPDDNGGHFPAEEPDPSGLGARGWDCARDWYADLWESINGDGSWDANPLVWVVEFRTVQAP